MWDPLGSDYRRSLLCGLMLRQKIEVGASETSVNFYRDTWRNVPEDNTHQVIISSLILLL
jgi:hypothetical protein